MSVTRRPRTLSFEILVSPSTDTKNEASINLIKDDQPQLRLFFGPMPNEKSHGAEKPWQFSFNIHNPSISAANEKTNGVSIPGRAVLWQDDKSCEGYGNVVVSNRTEFKDPDLRPRVISIRPSRLLRGNGSVTEIDPNALMYVQSEDSYINVRRDIVYRLDITFPDYYLLNQKLCQNWGFTACLVTGDQDRHRYVSEIPTHRFIDVRANWLDSVEPDVQADELEAARRNIALHAKSAPEIKLEPITEVENAPFKVNDLPLNKADALPSLDLVKIGVHVDSLATSSADRELLTVFSKLENRASYYNRVNDSPLNEVSRRLTHLISVSGQLAYWKQVEDFLCNEASSAKDNASSSTQTSTIPSIIPMPVSSSMAPASGKKAQGHIEKLIDISDRLLQAAMFRAKQVLDKEKENPIQRPEGKTQDDILDVLRDDKQWMVESKDLLIASQQHVSELFKYPSEKHAQFRKMKTSWPHDPRLLAELEKTGFAFKPQGIERDRCVCEQCRVPVTNWRPWHKPWLQHEVIRHTRGQFIIPPGTPVPTLNAFDDRKSDMKLKEYRFAMSELLREMKVTGGGRVNVEKVMKVLTTVPYVEYLSVILRLLNELQKTNMLTFDNLNLILINLQQAAAHIDQLILGISQLKQRDVFNQASFEMLLRNSIGASQIDELSAYGIRILQDAKLDTKNNLDAFMKDPHTITRTLSNVPGQELTQVRFNQIVRDLHNISVIAPFKSFMKANEDNALSRSIVPLIKHGMFANLIEMNKSIQSDNSISTKSDRIVAAYNAVFNPLGFSTQSTDVFEESLLRLSGITIKPVGCQYNSPYLPNRGALWVMYDIDCPAEHIVEALNTRFPGINARDISADCIEQLKPEETKGTCGDGKRKFIALNHEMVMSDAMVRTMTQHVTENPVLKKYYVECQRRAEERQRLAQLAEQQAQQAAAAAASSAKPR